MNKKIKVALITAKGDLDPNTGNGNHRYMYELYQNMKNNNRINISNIESPTLPIIGSGLSFFLFNCTRNFSGFNILHNLDFKPVMPLRKNNCTFISTVLDLQPILYPELSQDIERTYKEKLWSLLVIKSGIQLSLRADFIIAISSQTRDEVVKCGYDKNNIKVVNVGVDERFFSDMPVKKERRRFTVGYIGALRAKKNVQFAIKAFNNIESQDTCLEIWGKREFMYDELTEIAKKNKMISFKGFAPEEKLVDIYDSFDAFVFPSMHEGFGLPIIEAQARGIPVIIDKNGKIPREVRKYCFEAKDEEDMAEIIMKLKANGYDKKTREKMIAYARSFTWEKCTEKTLEVYYKISG